MSLQTLPDIVIRQIITVSFGTESHIRFQSAQQADQTAQQVQAWSTCNKFWGAQLKQIGAVCWFHGWGSS